MTATVPEVRIRKHRIIERPRLFALLDESKARVRTLVASAGYGKTTLAEQWVERSGRHGAWYTARSASTDVAALALGIARSSAAIVEGCDTRLREHLRALPAPAENVGVLAEILVEELATWPESAWLVIDDYHEIAEEPQAERLRRGARLRIVDQVPHRQQAAPGLGVDEDDPVRRRSRVEPDGARDGQRRSRRGARRTQRAVRVRPRFDRQRLAGCDRARERLLG